mgnify:CR=1 FL=1
MAPEALSPGGVRQMALDERPIDAGQGISQRDRSVRVRAWIDQESIHSSGCIIDEVKELTLVVEGFLSLHFCRR